MRSIGYTECFVLSKDDVLGEINQFPRAQVSFLPILLVRPPDFIPAISGLSDYYLAWTVCARRNAQVVTNLQQTCSNAVTNNLLTGCVRTACSQLVHKFVDTRLVDNLLHVC